MAKGRKLKRGGTPIDRLKRRLKAAFGKPTEEEAGPKEESVFDRVARSSQKDLINKGDMIGAKEDLLKRGGDGKRLGFLSPGVRKQLYKNLKKKTVKTKKR